MGIRQAFFAATYDRQLAKVEAAGLGLHRRRALAAVGGRVLEIGAGTGANLPLYGDAVETLTLTDPEPTMLRRLERKVRAQAPTAMVLRAPAEDLPFDDDSFDVAISTLVLCGVSDQPRALRELHRVVRPGGELRFIEHVRAPDARLARRQDRMNGINRFLVGCECNRSTLESIQAAGFDVTTVEHDRLAKMPPWVSPIVAGIAIAVPGERYSSTRSTDRQRTDVP